MTEAEMYLIALKMIAFVGFCVIAVACYMLKQLGEEWAMTVERGRRRHGR